MTQFFQTSGYEDMELSTQILISAALIRGIEVEIIDRQNNLIRLKKGNHVEYIQEGTKTSRDTYITAEILGNKYAQKQILKEADLNTPKSILYSDEKTALADYKKWKKGKIVIKPKTTNYGIGINILEKNFTINKYTDAIKEAFKFDNSILVEEFFTGIECRFLVIGRKTVAVLHRVPANIIGDGIHTIRQLVKLKNKDLLRGKGYKTPLEKIQLGTKEKATLKDLRFTLNSIPKKGITVFLRKNSNISTGGDSYDFTDKVHNGYKKIATKAAMTAQAKICGIDIISADFTKPPTGKNYIIIELNYNPVLYFHDFPFEGKNRKTGQHVLNLLGF